MLDRNRLKKQWKGITFLILPLLLLACTSVGGNEPTVAVPTGQPETDRGSLDGASPSASGDETYSPRPGEADSDATVVAPDEETTASNGEDDSPAASGKETIVAVPATVSFGKSTPNPAAGDGDPVEMPLPGAPNPARTMAEKARSDLARHLNVGPGKIEVLSIKAVQWPDSALGCPRPGQNYLTVITPGFQIVLEAEGRTFEYHTDQEERLTRCEAPPRGSKDGTQ